LFQLHLSIVQEVQVKVASMAINEQKWVKASLQTVKDIEAVA
jgi:hypothetical protein